MSFQLLFKALSDSNRRRILELLRPGPLSAGEIVSHFNSSGSTISKHLSILKQADLVIDKREGQYIYYELNASVLDSIIQWLIDLEK